MQDFNLQRLELRSLKSQEIAFLGLFDATTCGGGERVWWNRASPCIKASPHSSLKSRSALLCIVQCASPHSSLKIEQVCIAVHPPLKPNKCGLTGNGRRVAPPRVGLDIKVIWVA